MIGEARRTLEMMPEPALAYLILKADALEGGDEHFSTNWIQSQSIAKQYIQFDEQKISDVVHRVTHSDWVLGPKKNEQERNLQPFLQAVQELYFADYTQAWEQFFSSLKLKPLKELADIEKILSEAPSPFLKLAQFVVPHVQGKVQFEEWGTLLNEQQKPMKGFQNILKQLAVLHETINTILKSTHPDKAAFEVMKANKTQTNQLLEQIKNLPQPMRSWITNLVEKAHELIVKKAMDYIMLPWEKEIALASFENFFKPKGTLEQYFVTYLKPFVDISKARWQWREFGGKPLPFSDVTLLQFQRAFMI